VTPRPGGQLLDLGSHRTVALVRGPDDAETVCFVHPLGLDRQAFDLVVDRLAATWRCVTFDQRGHGAADAAPESIAIGTLAGDVVGVLDHLGAHRAHLVGHSLGGAVAATAAATAPGRFASLVLMATPDVGGPVFRERAEAAELHGLAPQLAPTLERWFSPVLRDASQAGVAYATRCLQAMSVPAWAACWRALADFPGYGGLAGRLPATRCVAGGEDASTPPATLGRIAALTGADLAVVPAAGHLLTWEEPGAVAALLAEHWRRAPV
jgi:3-oxoadipate enol-lactonase